MATTSSRDVRLGLTIATAGEDDVARLAAAVRSLGKEGDPAAAEFDRLANELDRLSAQAGAVQTLGTLRSTVEGLTEAEARAAAAAESVTARYREQSTAADALRAAQATARAEVVAAKAAYDDLNAAYKTLQNQGAAAGQSQAAFGAAVTEAKQQVIDQDRALKARNADLKDATSAVAEATKAETALSREFQNTTRAAAATRTALEGQAQALQAAEAAAVELGADVSDLAAAEQRLLAETQAQVSAAAALAAAEAESAQAMQALERAAVAAEAEVARLALTLRSAEAAAAEYAAATDAAAAAGTEDAAAARLRVESAQALIESDRALSIGQKELAAERDVSRAALVAEAQALLAQTRASEASLAATSALVRESQSLAAAMETAYGQTGVRSLEAIEAEIANVTRSVSLLERGFAAGTVSSENFDRAIGGASVRLQTLMVEAETIQTLPGTFDRIAASVKGALSQFGALGAAFATVGTAVKPVLDATIALEQMRRVLTTVTGSAEGAQQQIDYLRKVSQQSGQQFDELGKSYSQFAASALQSGLTVQQTQDVFKSVALAAGNLGLSTDQAKRALEALSQMASKGVVAMEELRQQLGDALPGVLPLLAKELGLTQAQLQKVVSSGQLLAVEGIPAIGRALTALQSQNGSVDGIVASFNRFINVVKEAGTVVIEGPLGSAVGIVLTAVAGVVRDLSVIVVGASEAFKLFGLSTLSVLDALRGNITLTQLKQQLSDFAVASGDRLAKFEQTAYGARDGVEALGGGLSKLGSSFAKLAIDQQSAIDKAELHAQSAQKGVKAAKDEAEAVTTLTGLIGDQNSARQGALQAANLTLAASEKQQHADEEVVASLTAARDATIAKAAAEGIGKEAIQATVVALNAKIAKAQADVDTTRAQTDAARAHAAAMDLAATSALDNSKRIDELKLAVQASELAFTSSVRAMRLDAGTSDDVKAAALALALAKGKLRDAIDDVSAALEREVAGLRASAELADAFTKLQIAQATTAQNTALAVGNETEARRQGIIIKQLELSLTKSSSDLKLQEAAATLRAVNSQEDELRSLGQLTPEKEAQLDVQRKTAEASVLEAQTSVETSKARQIEIDLLNRGPGARDEYNEKVDETRKAMEGETGAINTNTAARQKNNATPLGGGGSGGASPYVPGFNTESLDLSGVTAANKKTKADSDASDAARKAENSVPIDDSTKVDLETRYRSGALTANDLTTAKANYDAAQNNAATMREVLKNSASAYDPVAITDTNNSLRIAKEVLDRVTALANQASGTGNTGKSTSHTVTINLNGQATTINAASATDASSLTALLAQLGSAASRAATGS